MTNKDQGSSDPRQIDAPIIGRGSVPTPVAVDPREQLYAAVKHMLDQIQENPDVHYYCGWGTQIFYLLIRAEAAHLGKPLEEIETMRREDRQPSYRRREPEVNRLRTKLDELRAQLDGAA